MPAKKRHDLSQRARRLISLIRVAYDFVLLVAGGSIGALMAIYYQLTMPNLNSALTIFMILVVSLMMYLAMLFIMRRALDQVTE